MSAGFFAMDVARFGPYATNDRYLRDTTAQFYARRFVMAYPNEELPAGRPLKMTPCYDAFGARNARFYRSTGSSSVPGLPAVVRTTACRRDSCSAA